MYYKQNTKNDCAYTCLCILLRKSWTTFKNNDDFALSFRSYVSVNPKRKKLVYPDVQYKRKHNYIHKSLGMFVPHIAAIASFHGYQIKSVKACKLKTLSKKKTYLISVPSKNFQHAGHMIIYNKGRIFDPSRLKTYDYNPFLEIEHAIELTPRVKSVSLSTEYAWKIVTSNSGVK